MKNNNIKPILLFLIILSVICTISYVNAIDYDTNCSENPSDSTLGELSEIYVSSDASDETGDGSSQKPFKSLECAVNNSKDDTTIYLNDGEYVGENNRNISIDKSITIIGKTKENTIINGESCGRLFFVNSSSLTLINLTLINGYSSENGGMIYCNMGEINIHNCILKNSSSSKDGGTIYNNLGALNIENSCFTNNHARDYGGVLYSIGTAYIKNSNFTENTLTSEGGVGACIGVEGTINLDGCLFYDCYTQYAAAGLLNKGKATINNCRFEKLATDYAGGAISNHGNMKINNSYFGHNYAQFYASAILAITGGPHVVTEVYNTIFEKNHAEIHGAITNNFKNCELYMQNCALIDNYLKLNEAYGDISLDDNATVQYCWWGQNEINPDYYSPHSGEIHPEKINASRWLVMTFTASNNVIYKNENNQLTVSLKHYFNNETKEIYEYNEEINLPLEVTFYTSTGTLAKKKLVNGVATFDYNPQDDVNAIYAEINNQVLKIDNFQFRKTAIIVSDFEKYYGSDSKLAIKLIKENNVALSNEKLTVSFEGNVYTIKTDENGMAKISLKNFPKKYAVLIIFNGNNYIPATKTIKVTVIKPIIKASKLKIRKKGKFTVTFNANKKAIKNVQIKFKIKGKTYIKTTNSKGQAKIPINLKPGKYTVKVGFKNTKYYGTTTLTEKIKVIK